MCALSHVLRVKKMVQGGIRIPGPGPYKAHVSPGPTRGAGLGAGLAHQGLLAMRVLQALACPQAQVRVQVRGWGPALGVWVPQCCETCRLQPGAQTVSPGVSCSSTRRVFQC